MRLHLRDINLDIVTAWHATFREIEDVEISQGEIFDVRADAIVSPANSFGFMDGGIDLVYSLHFGWELQDRLQDVLRRDFHGELPVGQAVIVPTLHADIPFLVSAPTMRVPEDVSQSVHAYLAFRAAILAVRKHNATHEHFIESVLCPGLATAVGRMPPFRCAGQMLQAYRNAYLDPVPSRPYAGHVLDEHQRMLR